jgi:hypothetical protein
MNLYWSYFLIIILRYHLVQMNFRLSVFDNYKKRIMNNKMRYIRRNHQQSVDLPVLLNEN